ncbi:24-methylenesterol C-methyltransferase 2, partial [Linum perenne]
STKILFVIFYWFVCLLGSAKVTGQHASLLTGGSISGEKIQDKYNQHCSFFRSPSKVETTDKVPAFVDTFYNLIIDIYEWGWGSPSTSPLLFILFIQSSSPSSTGFSASLAQPRLGDRILEAGCGVSGPMRVIVSHSGANVVGITINEYQVNRARMHNKKADLDTLCEVVMGNFLLMSFEDQSFDGAYLIEATCHDPKLEEVYYEIFRVLKPRAVYVLYEWVTTNLFKVEDPVHVEIIKGIERGDAFPWMSRYDDIAKMTGVIIVSLRVAYDEKDR